MTKAQIYKDTVLAEKMRVSPKTLSMWLTAERYKLTPELLFRLADALKVNPKWLALGPPHAMMPLRSISLEDEEVLQIKDALDGEARQQWISSGRTMVRLTAPRSAANPYPIKK
jgi:transcriptional regulator with XRE-family HTH domain